MSEVTKAKHWTKAELFERKSELESVNKDLLEALYLAVNILESPNKSASLDTWLTIHRTISKAKGLNK